MSYPLLQAYRCNGPLNGLNTCVSKDTLDLDLHPTPKPRYNRAHSLKTQQPIVLNLKRVQTLHTSNSLMDLRSCGMDGDDTGHKSVTVHRQSSFSRKAASLKRLSRFVAEPNSYSASQTAVEEHLSSLSDHVNSNSTWKLQSIPSSYSEIMDTNILSEESIDQQAAIWELIQTEHCFLSQLATIKNVFLYCLDSLKSANLLITNGTDYHEIFGNINEIYLAHLCFWKKALLPCLQKASLYHIPISLSDLVRRFPNCKELFFVHEEYCISHNTNLQKLDKAMKIPEFKTYIKWCESRPECQRLHLKDFLAKPMQRVTKYPLLLKVMLKRTGNKDVKEQLTAIVEDMEQLVQAINLAVQNKEEISKVKEVAQRITSYNMGDFPRGWEEFLQPFMQFDLMAPMPGIDHMYHRKLLLDGALRYKDSFSKVDTCVFLFTDILVIAKPVKKGSEQLTIYKPPFRVDQLLIKEGSNPACFNVVYMSELQVPILWFNLRAATPHSATVWMKKIRLAQKQYVLLTNKRSVSATDTVVTLSSNGSDTSLSTFGDEDVDLSPDTPHIDSVPLVRISHCTEDDDVYEDTQQNHKSYLSFVITPSCSSSSLTISQSIATQTDFSLADKARHT